VVCVWMGYGFVVCEDGGMGCAVYLGAVCALCVGYGFVRFVWVCVWMGGNVGTLSYMPPESFQRDKVCVWDNDDVMMMMMMVILMERVMMSLMGSV